MRNKNLASIFLAVMNIVCALFHAIFQARLGLAEGIYRGFLLTENMVITFVFTYFSLALLFGKTNDRASTIRMNILFWLFFLIFVLFIQPKVTTLNIVEKFLIFPQNYYLLFLGTVSLILSLLAHIKLGFEQKNRE